jgi:glycosyltransferase involved in cell wall biosynthesis
MRILYLAPANSPHSSRWIRWFSTHGHTIRWVSVNERTVTVPDDVTLRVVSGGTSPRRYLAWRRAVREELAAFRPDVVHVHSIGTYALVARAVRGVPIVTTAWGSDVVEGSESFLRRIIMRGVLARSSVVTADAEHMMPRLRALGVPPERLRVINFGVETDQFVAPTAPRLAAPGSPTGPVRIISLRMLHPIYDLATLVRAAALLRERRVPCVVDIHADGSERQALEAQARAAGLEEMVTFKGRYNHETLKPILWGADVYVSTSTADAGIAASTAEAMATELPVVISDSAENGLWIDDGANGFLFPTGDATVLADRLQRLVEDPALRARLGRAGRATIIARNDYDGEMRKMDALYAEAARVR